MILLRTHSATRNQHGTWQQRCVIPWQDACQGKSHRRPLSAQPVSNDRVDENTTGKQHASAQAHPGPSDSLELASSADRAPPGTTKGHYPDFVPDYRINCTNQPDRTWMVDGGQSRRGAQAISRITVLMSASWYPMLSMVVPVLDDLKDYLRMTERGLDGLRSIFLDQLIIRFGDVFTNQELCVATLVNPRFKDVLYSADQRSEVIEWTVKQMTPAAAIAAGTVALSSCPCTSVAISTPPKKPSIFDKLDRSI